MGGKLGYRPALDGVRALSIALVLVFHLGAPWLEGGYLGVSVFFTLSGFLITSLLLAERSASGRIDVRAFYVRRMRRLLPAAMLVLLGIALLAALGEVAARSDLRGGVLAGVFQVANWHQLLSERSYADLFLAPSPVDHFWSLAIEEQFYWVWPLAMAGLTTVAPRRVGRILAVGFVVFAASALVTARVAGGDAAYFASWARFPEILAGAALAAALHGRPVPAWAARLAAPSLVAVVALAAFTPAGRGWAYAGGLPLFALLSAALILGVQAPGPVARLLSTEPLPWIGRISYGLYLFHWPVFTILGDAGVAEKLALTGGLTVASYYLVERPIRTGVRLSTRRAFVPAAAGTLLVVAAAVVVLVPTVDRPVRTSEPVVLVAAGAPVPPRPASTESPALVAFEALVEEPEELVLAMALVVSASARSSDGTVPVMAADSAPSAVASSRIAPDTFVPDAVAPTATGPRVVAIFGDSIADWLLRDAAATFDRPDVVVIDAAIEGCDGAVDIPTARGRAGQILPLPADCDEWPVTYAKAVEDPSLLVDVALLMVGNAPIVDRLVGDRWVGPCDDLQWYAEDVTRRIDYLRSHAGRVVLVLPAWGGDKARFLATDDHLERSACIRSRLLALAGDLEVPVIDLAEILCPSGPDGPCSDLRETDGTHVDPDDAALVLGWLLDRS